MVATTSKSVGYIDFGDGCWLSTVGDKVCCRQIRDTRGHQNTLSTNLSGRLKGFKSNSVQLSHSKIKNQAWLEQKYFSFKRYLSIYISETF